MYAPVSLVYVTYGAVGASGSVERSLIVVNVAVAPDWMKTLHVAT